MRYTSLKSWCSLTAVICCLCGFIMGSSPSFAYDADRIDFSLSDGNDVSSKSSPWNSNLKQYLMKYLGIRYKRGGASPQGFDCSGFARHIYKNIYNVELPHNASSQYPSSLLSSVPSDELKPGDLIFFSATSKKKRINHVGIYLDEGKFIHAELKRGIVISDLGARHWKSRIVSAKRLIDETAEEETFAVSADTFDSTFTETTFALGVPKKPAAHPSNRTYVNSIRPSVAFELAYTQFLFNNSLNLHFGYFFETFSVPRVDSPIPFSILVPTYSQFNLTRGFRIAGDIKPLTGLCISPVVSYYDHAHTDMFYDIPERSLGIDVSLGSVQSWGWSLSTAVQQLSLPDREKYTGEYDRSAYDLSLTYRQKLSDRLLFSLTGEHFRYPSLQFGSDEHDVETYNQRIFFLLHFTY